MDNNWKTATKADRAALYHVARAVADTTDLSVEAIMEEAFGHKLMVGTDYLSNFRSGAIGRPKAKLIHAWIAEHHAETAHAIDPRLFPKQHTNAWADYLENYAITGKLHIARFDKSMGLVQRKRTQPVPEEVLKLGEEFCFQLDSKITGHAVAFQMYEGTMHPMPLGLNGELSTTIKRGKHFLPIDEIGEPEMLVEMTSLGKHQFIVAVARQITELPTPSGPLNFHSETETHTIRVQITP